MKRLAVLAWVAWLAGAPAHADGRLTGVNLSGPELSSGSIPGRAGSDYVYPDAATMRHFRQLGATCLRLPVLWERLQPDLDGKLNRDELARLDAAIKAAQASGVRLVIDIHDYGRWRGRPVGEAVPDAAFARFWSLLARHVATLPGGSAVIFGLMNEPHDIPPSRWAQSEQQAITAIRATGARNLLLLSGSDWDGAHSFLADGNAEAVSSLHDPAGNSAIELHQYLDPDSSGTHAECASPDATVARVAPVTAWLRAHRWRAFLGEFAASATPDCLRSLDALLSFLDHNPDVWIGWTGWAAGPWWGDYMFSLQPKDGRDTPQMSLLARHMRGAP